MARSGWSEDQIKATVKAYFELLRVQSAGKRRNKSAIYQQLSKRFPMRSPKAFELKFQNISAILYEENIPYCDGLKPRFNYQNLLRLVVLDRLKRSPIPVQEPHEILFRKLRELGERGYLPVVDKGTGRFGLTIERFLGIPPSSSKNPDFMGIELKTKQDRSLQTLFAKVPTRYTGCADKAALLDDHGYDDKARGRRALYTSFSSNADSLGFRLVVRADRIVVVRRGCELLEYDAEQLEAALLSKHSQTAFVALSSRKRDGREECKVDSAVFCKWPSIIRFLRLASGGNVFLDFTLYRDGNRVRDHGFLWRLPSAMLPELYLWTETQKLA
jgi:hypothetical protein